MFENMAIEQNGKGLTPRSMVVSSRPPSSALLPFVGEGSPTKIDYRKKGTLILTSLLEDLVVNQDGWTPAFVSKGGSYLG